VQVIDPAAFGGAGEFCRETSWLADKCRASAPISDGSPVRLPGQAGLARKRKAEADGVEVYPGILDALAPYATKFGVLPPKNIS